VWFLQGLVTGELAWFHAVWQTLVAGGLVALGALDDGLGRAGLAVVAASVVGLVVLQWRQTRAATVLDRALRDSVDSSMPALPSATGRVQMHALLRPLAAPGRGVDAHLDVPYGPHPRQRLDVLHPADQPRRAPVVVHVHGGSWVGGRRTRQSQTLRYEFARHGWISIAAGYRVSPDATFPEHLVDVKRVIAWVREHAAELGADPDQVMLSGVSAGAHLASLATLTPNEAALQPGFEHANTSVMACVATSGIYDLLDRHGDHPGSNLVPFLANVVLKSDPVTERTAWDAASPIARVHPDAPPFLVIHGHDDALAWREEARRFVGALRPVARAPVAYAELPGTQHAFETFYSVRSAHTAIAAVRFGDWVRTAVSGTAQEATTRARG
jgi:acetyl esterase/lipase